MSLLDYNTFTYFKIIILDAFHTALVKAKETVSKWVAEIIVKQKDGSCVDIVPLLGNQSNPAINEVVSSLIIYILYSYCVFVLLLDINL